MSAYEDLVETCWEIVRWSKRVESVGSLRNEIDRMEGLLRVLCSGEDPPGYVECGAVPPLPATPACMRERGHEGAHQSCSEDNVLSTWSCPNEAISGVEFLRGMQRALPDGYPIEAAPDSGPVKPDWHEEKLRSLSLEDLEGILEDDGWFSQHEGREILRRLKDRRESPSTCTPEEWDRLLEEKRTLYLENIELRGELDALRKVAADFVATWDDPSGTSVTRLNEIRDRALRLAKAPPEPLGGESGYPDGPPFDDGGPRGAGA